MKRIFSCLLMMTFPPAAALTAAMVAEGIFGWGAWVYWGLGGAGGVAGLGLMLVAWRDSDERSNPSDYLVSLAGLFLSVMFAGAVFLAAYNLGWSQVMRHHHWEDWQRATGRITGGSVTTYYTDSKHSPFNRHTTDFSCEFMVDGLKFSGSGSDSGEAGIGTSVQIWFNPRDPSQNIGRLNSEGSPLPKTRGVSPDFHLVTGFLAAVSAAMLALVLATPLRYGWWLPPVTALLIGGAYSGGTKFGEYRATRRAGDIERQHPSLLDVEDALLANLWRRSYAENLPAWRGRSPIKWALALKRKQGHEQAGALAALESITAADRDAVPVLLELLRFDPATHVRQALVRIGSPSVPGLIKLAADPRSETRSIAARALGEFPGEATTIAPVLVELIVNRDYSLMLGAVESLGKLSAKSDLALEHLTRQLYQTNADVISLTVHQLGILGPRGKAAEQRLTELAKDQRFQKQATEALRSIRGGQSPAP